MTVLIGRRSQSPWAPQKSGSGDREARKSLRFFLIPALPCSFSRRPVHRDPLSSAAQLLSSAREQEITRAERGSSQARANQATYIHRCRYWGLSLESPTDVREIFISYRAIRTSKYPERDLGGGTVLVRSIAHLAPGLDPTQLPTKPRHPERYHTAAASTPWRAVLAALTREDLPHGNSQPGALSSSTAVVR